MPNDAESDGIEAVLERLERDGYVAQAQPAQGGERRWYLTAEGQRYVHDLLKSNPAAKKFLDELLARRN